MGCTTIGYGVDLRRVAAVRGSRDAALVVELEQKFADRLAHEQEMNANLYGLPISLNEALLRIVMGDLAEQSQAVAAQYVYAYELLCEHFGRPLDGREHIEFLDDLRWDTAALVFRTPLDLPSAGPLPTTGYLTPDEVQSEYERFKSYNSDEDTAELADAREEFIWWLKQCADEGLGLVTFCY
jgi:hypothetical protein